MRRKVIWLCSWYPNQEDRFTGDFIQRQAIAASHYADIEVVHVAHAHEEHKTTHNVNTYLKETIYYSKSSSKLKQYKEYFQLHESFISDYINRKGKPDLIHVHIPMRAGMVALRWKQIYGWPFLVSEHYGIYNTHVKDRFEKRNYFFRYFTRKIFKKADYFLSVSNFLGQAVNKHVITKHYEIVPNVVDTNLFFFLNEKQITKFKFIHVSDGSEIKNVNGIFKAVERLYKQRQDFELICIGITNSKYIKWLSEATILNNVIKLIPPLPYEEVATEVRQANAGVLFSFEETQSCVVLEWLCAGLPVITSDVGGVGELISEENGLLVCKESIEQLTKCMSKLIDTYNKYHGDKIATDAASTFSYNAVGTKLNSYYDKY